MPKPVVNTADIWEGQDVVLYDRAVTAGGTPLTEDDVTSVTVRVFRDGRGKKLLDAASPSGIVFDSLSTSEGWTKDATGWNVRVPIGYADMKLPGSREYRVETVLATQDHGNVPLVWLVRVKGLGSF